MEQTMVYITALLQDHVNSPISIITLYHLDILKKILLIHYT